MKKEKGITLVSLVVTIIILIILAGVSINLTLGKNGIITMAKQAKENTELAKIEEETALNELYMQIESEGGTSGEISYDAIAKLTEFKTAIANYIEEAGGVKPETTADATAFGESIKGILKEATKDATATADNITEGMTAYVNGELITGTGVDNNSYYNDGYNQGMNNVEPNLIVANENSTSGSTMSFTFTPTTEKTIFVLNTKMVGYFNSFNFSTSQGSISVLENCYNTADLNGNYIYFTSVICISNLEPNTSCTVTVTPVGTSMTMFKLWYRGIAI